MAIRKPTFVNRGTVLCTLLLVAGVIPTIRAQDEQPAPHVEDNLVDPLQGPGLVQATELNPNLNRSENQIATPGRSEFPDFERGRERERMLPDGPITVPDRRGLPPTFDAMEFNRTRYDQTLINDLPPQLRAFRTRTRARVVAETFTEPISDAEIARHNRWQELAKQIRDTTDEDQRKQLGLELQTVLNEIFDEDVKAREAELSSLEERFKKLRDALERRKTSRDRIIQLQVDSVLLDAEGLGFPGAGNSSPVPFGDSTLPLGAPASALNRTAPWQAAPPQLTQRRKAVPVYGNDPGFREAGFKLVDVNRQNGQRVVQVDLSLRTSTTTPPGTRLVPGSHKIEFELPSDVNVTEFVNEQFPLRRVAY